jgi:hypothetical protein
MPRQEKQEEKKEDIVELAKIVQQAAMVHSNNQYWSESARRSTDERIALAEIQAKERTETARLRTEEFEFKVRMYTSDGMSGAEAMIAAKDLENREAQLRAEELKLKEDREALEHEKGTVRPYYFMGGVVVSIVTAGIIGFASSK